MGRVNIQGKCLISKRGTDTREAIDSSKQTSRLKTNKQQQKKNKNRVFCRAINWRRTGLGSLDLTGEAKIVQSCWLQEFIHINARLKLTFKVQDLVVTNFTFVTKRLTPNSKEIYFNFHWKRPAKFMIS